MSLVDNGFHIKISPITSTYLDKFSSILYSRKEKKSKKFEKNLKKIKKTIEIL